MTDVFISYARSTGETARRIAEAIRALGYGVWQDQELPPHRDYSEVIEERLQAAKAVVVVWSADAVRSQWVRAEADVAREAGTLVQLSVDRARLPMPFNRIQCADLAGWTGEAAAPEWRKVVASIAELAAAGGAPRSAETDAAPAAAPPLPSKPSIAVLPFADLTPGKDQAYFCDGMVVEIATALGKFPSLFVIAASSSLSYRDQGVSHRQIAGELGVRYLLNGNVRKSGERVRIAVELLDAVDGGQVWAERFDGALDDVFALQDDVSRAVAAQLHPAMVAAEARRAAARPTDDLGAYDLFLRAHHRAQAWTPDAFRAAITLADQAIDRDPDYALALAFAGFCHATSVLFGWADDSARSAKLSMQLAHRALAASADEPEALNYVAIGTAFLGGDITTCNVMIDRAIELNPGYGLGWFNSGWIKMMAGDAATGLAHLQTAMRLDPRPPWRPQVITGVGFGHYLLGRYEAAIAPLTEAATVQPGFGVHNIALAGALARVGRQTEAKAALAGIDYGLVDAFVDIFRGEADRALLREGMALASD